MKPQGQRLKHPAHMQIFGVGEKELNQVNLYHECQINHHAQLEASDEQLLPFHITPMLVPEFKY